MREFAGNVARVAVAIGLMTLVYDAAFARLMARLTAREAEEERARQQVVADRRARSERDAALLERDAAVRRALGAEYELAALRLALDEWRRGAAVAPRAEAPELIPAPVEPFPIPERGEKP